MPPGGVLHHVLNRAAGRRELFAGTQDYAAFQRVLHETVEATGMRLCGFCAMPNHWHLVLWPREDGELSRFMQKLTIRHVRRWVEHRHRVGYGSVYQGRYKSFPLQDDAHFSTVVRYVERNPLRCGLVTRAEDWPWSSLGQKTAPDSPLIALAPWPVPRRDNWLTWVNQAQTPAEMAALRHCLRHGRPFGSEPWTARMESTLNLPAVQPHGRPKKRCC